MNIGRTAIAAIVVLYALSALCDTRAGAEEATRERIAVLEMEGIGTSAVEAVAITDRLREALLKSGHYTVVDRSQMEAILNEQALQQMSCNRPDCAVQVGQVLGVSKIVAGKVSKFSERMWQVSAMVVDVRTAETISADSVRHEGDILALLDREISRLAEKLVVASTAPKVTPPTLTGRWSVLTPMGVPRWGHGSAVVGHRIFVAGGASMDNKPVDMVEVFDTTRNAWEEAATLPQPRVHVAVAAVGSRVYVIGGAVGDAPVARVDVLETLTAKWQQGPHLPGARAGAMAATLAGRLYVIGGLDAEGDYVDETLVLSPDGRRWERRAALRYARAYAAVAVTAGSIYVIAGEGKSRGLVSIGSVSLNKVEVYTPGDNRWREAASIPRARSQLAAAALAGRIYVFGGFLGNFVNLANKDDYQVFDPVADEWLEAGMMDRSRATHTAAAVNERIYLIGGKTAPPGAVSELR